MKKEQNKFQDKSKKSEIKKPEEEITSTEKADEIIENEPEEIQVDEETETDEEILVDEETENDEEIQDDELPPNLQEKKADTEPKPETKSEAENAELTNKQKVKALKRAIENKKYSLDRETEKCRTWRVQAKDRDEKATNEYQKRKKELEEQLKKSEERYNKRIARTKKWWWEFCVNFENTKIKKINDDLTLLQTELSKLEEHEPENAE